MKKICVIKNLMLILFLITLLIICTLLFCSCKSGNGIDIKYKIIYMAEMGGTIDGETTQVVNKDGDGTTVTAIPNEGYKFVKWSDGIQTPERIDLNVTGNFEVIAEFTEQIFNVSYAIGENGTFYGESVQTVPYGKDAMYVYAIADSGYEFAGWSDGVNTHTRWDKDVKSDIYVVGYFKRITHEIRYIAGANGSVKGESLQIINRFEDATAVVAEPDEGYMFTDWSDGKTTAERHDKYITEAATFTANFAWLERTYKYDYRLATSGIGAQSLTLKYDGVKDITFPIPQREHFTFGGWYVGDIKVSDEQGNLLVGNEIFKNGETDIYAKWTANETFNYKILLVHVTDVDLMYENRKVKYKMTEAEKKMCHNAAILFQQYLNDMLDGLVRFEVDEYYTTEQINNSNFKYPWLSITPDEIDEIKRHNFNLQYKSLISTVKYDFTWLDTPNISGSADIKYATVKLNSYLCRPNGTDIDDIQNYLELDYSRWTWYMETFVHEFIHTIELNIGIEGHEGLHKSLGYISQKPTVTAEEALTIEKMYLFNSVIREGTNWGIPYEYWAGKMQMIDNTGW